MSWFGKMSKCCCFSLAVGCIIAAVFHFLLCIIAIFSKEDDYKIWVIISSAVIGVLIILGITLKNYVIMIIVSVLVGILACVYSITLVFVIITLFSKDKSPFADKLYIAIFFIILISLILFCFNIYLSTSNVLKVGGTGWECKNYLQIQDEKAEKEKSSAHINDDDYKA